MRFRTRHAVKLRWKALSWWLCRGFTVLGVGFASAVTPVIAVESEVATRIVASTPMSPRPDASAPAAPAPPAQPPALRLRYQPNVSLPTDAATPQTFYDETERTLCRTRPQRFCGDLAKAEFEVTSLHFLVPTVPGLTSKSITFRHHAVVMNYTFR